MIKALVLGKRAPKIPLWVEVSHIRFGSLNTNWMQEIGAEQYSDEPNSPLFFLFQAILKFNRVQNNAILDQLELIQAFYPFEAIKYLDIETRKIFDRRKSYKSNVATKAVVSFLNDFFEGEGSFEKNLRDCE